MTKRLTISIPHPACVMANGRRICSQVPWKLSGFLPDNLLIIHRFIPWVGETRNMGRIGVFVSCSGPQFVGGQYRNSVIHFTEVKTSEKGNRYSDQFS